MMLCRAARVPGRAAGHAGSGVLSKQFQPAQKDGKQRDPGSQNESRWLRNQRCDFLYLSPLYAPSSKFEKPVVTAIYKVFEKRVAVKLEVVSRFDSPSRISTNGVAGSKDVWYRNRYVENTKSVSTLRL